MMMMMMCVCFPAVGFRCVHMVCVVCVVVPLMRSCCCWKSGEALLVLEYAFFAPPLFPHLHCYYYYCCCCYYWMLHCYCWMLFCDDDDDEWSCEWYEEGHVH